MGIIIEFEYNDDGSIKSMAFHCEPRKRYDKKILRPLRKSSLYYAVREVAERRLLMPEENKAIDLNKRPRLVCDNCKQSSKGMFVIYSPNYIVGYECCYVPEEPFGLLEGAH